MAKEKKDKEESSKSMKDARHKDFNPGYQNLYAIRCCSEREDCVVRPFMKIDDDLPNRA